MRICQEFFTKKQNIFLILKHKAPVKVCITYDGCFVFWSLIIGLTALGFDRYIRF